MDRRAKNQERKRKEREQAKKKAAAAAAKRPGPLELMVRAASHAQLAECFVSAGWNDEEEPALVSVVVTRPLPNGNLAVGSALVDRTCLGIKDAYVFQPLAPADLPTLTEHVGSPHGGMEPCEALVAQSIVFHALDYAQSLGFGPHADFQEILFGPRPETLLSTPWSKAERPIYFPGPHENAGVIVARLKKAVGPDGFDFVDPSQFEDEGDDEGDVVMSSLGRTIERDGVTLEILIYRGEAETEWILEVQDHLGGSTVWDELFASEQAALDAALLAIEEEGVESLVVDPDAKE